jgi:hypothetical protein
MINHHQALVFDIGIGSRHVSRLHRQHFLDRVATELFSRTETTYMSSSGRLLPMLQIFQGAALVAGSGLGQDHAGLGSGG